MTVANALERRFDIPSRSSYEVGIRWTSSLAFSITTLVRGSGISDPSFELFKVDGTEDFEGGVVCSPDAKRADGGRTEGGTA